MGYDLLNLAAVCGSEVRIYGPLYDTRRRLLNVMQFPHYGAALTYAVEYDERQRALVKPPQQ